MEEIRVYEVGGSVRDRFIGLRNKDVDFVVVGAPSFQAMCYHIETVLGVEIKVVKEEFVTVRGIHPTLGGVDYVLAREDGEYKDGRRPENVKPGTLIQDLARRDFTMNAIAMDEDGSVIDPFEGRADIRARIIRCVGDTEQRMWADALRMARAMRFAVTKNFYIHGDIVNILNDADWVGRLSLVSVDRVRDEVGKMFRYNTLRTMQLFSAFPLMAEACFGSTGIWLEATSKGRN